MLSIKKIRSIANYQFGKGAGKTMFPDGVRILHSQETGRIRYIFLKEDLIATSRPTDGLFSLTIEGGSRLLSIKPNKCWVQVQSDVAEFIAKGRSVFAKHVVNCDLNIRPREEVVVIDNQRKVLAVGKAILTGKEMLAFQQGVAVRVRHGLDRIARENIKKEDTENNFGSEEFA